ncbi:hypothetical protein GCK32_001409 [Trichostrongylus colubriformis]|uniref:Uncharacterized protein n=1 Tax=Trichostrongylus colubriformis TaxID=6319 RepID=A0AAN8F2V0_TRICO
MLFYVLIAFIALSVFTQEGVIAQSCQDMIPSLCSTSYNKYCSDNDDLGTQEFATKGVATVKHKQQVNTIDDHHPVSLLAHDLHL